MDTPVRARVVLNDAVSIRGTSGSSIGGRLIERALGERGYVVTTVAPGPRSRSRLRNLTAMLWWESLGLARAARSLGADVVVNLANTGIARDIPTVTVLHDTMPFDHADLFDPFFRWYAAPAFGRSVRNARSVVVPSERSATGARTRWPDVDYAVIPWPAVNVAAAPRRRPASSNVIVIAETARHKRLPLAVECVARLRRHSGIDFGLTLIAKPGNDSAGLEDAIARHGAAKWAVLVRETLPHDELIAIIDDCFCLLSTSIDEGFGLPVLEAAARGVPVIHTGRGAMSEILPLPADVMPRAGDLPATDGQRVVAQLTALRSPDVWAAAAQQAWERSREFRFDVFAQRWADVIESAIHR